MIRHYIVQYLPWIMSVLSCVTLYLAGSKKSYAWAVMLGSQVLWFIWIPLSGSWGLMPGAIAYTAVALRNHVRWMGEKK